MTDQSENIDITRHFINDVFSLVLNKYNKVDLTPKELAEIYAEGFAYLIAEFSSNVIDDADKKIEILDKICSRARELLTIIMMNDDFINQKR